MVAGGPRAQDRVENVTASGRRHQRSLGPALAVRTCIRRSRFSPVPAGPAGAAERAASPLYCAAAPACRLPPADIPYEDTMADDDLDDDIDDEEAGAVDPDLAELEEDEGDVDDPDVDTEDDDADLEDDEDQGEVVVQPGKERGARTRSDADSEEEEEEDEEVDDDEVEASLDVILKERLVVVDDEEEDDEDPSEPGDRSEGTAKVLPKQPGEFLCQSCFLVKHPSQLADEVRMYCRDCV